MPLETDATFSIFQYHVCFEPEVDSKAVRQAILSQEAIVSEIGNKLLDHFPLVPIIPSFQHIRWHDIVPHEGVEP